MSQSKQARGVHDLGGTEAGPIDRDEHAMTFRQRRIDALSMLLRDGKRQMLRADVNRRLIETLPEERYHGGYYPRWVDAMRAALVEQGVLTEAEIAAKLAEVKRRYGKS